MCPNLRDSKNGYLDLAEDVVKPIKKAEDIKKLAADALGYFPAEFEAAKQQASGIAAAFLESLSTTPAQAAATKTE